MEVDGYEYYKQRAAQESDPTKIAGRYGFQREAERRIVLDVATKLDLAPSDRLLDIGGGPGNLAIPLSFMVAKVCVVDNPEALKMLRARVGLSSNIGTIEGDFDTAMIGEEFDKILIYSVVQCLPDLDAIKNFLTKAMRHLVPGGRMLIGDLPNISHKQRFSRSKRAAAVERSWSARMKEEDRSDSGEGRQSEVTIRSTTIDDVSILELLKYLRSLGAESYLLPQPCGLPFGLTREDIVVISHD